MSETKQKYATKRLIHVTKEQEERMAQQSHAKVQTFVNEANQIQARRFELSSALLIAEVTRNGSLSTSSSDVDRCRSLASKMVGDDSFQKWTDLKALFVELDVRGPQPALEWAAKQAGVTLFDPLPEAPEESLIIDPATEDMAALEKVSH